MRTTPPPGWFKLIVILAVLPVLAYPFLMAGHIEGGRNLWLLRLYPVAEIVGAVCAWRTYVPRRETAWILIAIMLLTHGAMWLLAYPL